MDQVTVAREPLTLPTYGLGEPEKNPMFFEKRVYQGSSGKVYPTPFIDRVEDDARPVEYDSVRLENEHVRLVILPEIGGRIFLAQDRSNGDYDFFYRQDVIKPALVGLAGPWISGGVEFNWPQHHRPGTFMPADVHVEHEPDGARTVWLSEHDPMDRLKGMHGVRLRPGSAVVELRVRLYNRTAHTQTFLWWANVAARVHDDYQSFFPPDVDYVADHAVRAQSSFPIANNDYYGIDYASRPGANDLSWYRNIPVPTSYMVCQTEYDFFGGYDHAAGGGFVHVADRHVAPGKKQWTWGNGDFGYAWDRELTDENGPYVELMAGVYTDNQPDFAYLAPYETKAFSQHWWPYQRIGPVQNASREAAVHLSVGEGGLVRAGVAVSEAFPEARVLISLGENPLVDARVDLAPGAPWQGEASLAGADAAAGLCIAVFNAEGRELVAYRPGDVKPTPPDERREVATEPPLPAELATADELFLTAEHLEQYRHPTRSPEPYWREALRRDPSDSRANTALGKQRLRRGQFEQAAEHLERAVRRLTHRHPNPITGEAHYCLGLARLWAGNEKDASKAFSKATWDYAWRSAGSYQLANLACRRGDYAGAVEHCEASLDANRRNNKAVVLKAAAQRRLGAVDREELDRLLIRDPLDHWARFESGDASAFLSKSRNDAQTVLDIAYDYADAGLLDEAIDVLRLHHQAEPAGGSTPNPLGRSVLTRYALAWLLDKQSAGGGREALAAARRLPADYLFPSRLHDQAVLEWALRQEGPDRNAAFGLGNFYYDRRRHLEAIAAWQQAAEHDPRLATAHRNLGIAYWNVHRDGPRARAAYDKACASAPNDARLFYERDQLRKKLGDPPQERLGALLERRELVTVRDDCCVELASLYNETDQPTEGLAVLLGRRFHPWEGGEGQVLRQYARSHLLLGERLLAAGDAETALAHFDAALRPPTSLGEAFHPLQAKADVLYWRGLALRRLGRERQAEESFSAAANEAGDFLGMAVAEHSELSYFRGLALRELGRESEAAALFQDLRRFAREQSEAEAKIDYFATSLPLLLVFDDDLDKVQRRNADHLLELAERGLDGIDAR